MAGLNKRPDRMRRNHSTNTDNHNRHASSSESTTNGSLSQTSDTDSASPSNSSERRFVHRSSVICSSGNDKFTYDSERADVPLRSIDIDPWLMDGGGRSGGRSPSQVSNLSLCSDSSELPNFVKRDSIVQRFAVQKSICVNGRYQNPFNSWRPPTFTNILKFGLTRDKSNIPTKQDLDLALPIMKPVFKDVPPYEGIRITWLGHSTVVVQLDDITLITDPMFSERASPSQVVGPKRYRECPCTVHDLPNSLDAVLISHSHYDHLDLNSVVLLNARYGCDLRWFVPIGLGEWMHQIGCDNVVELDWWEENCVPDKSEVSFVFTPAQHWSKRTITDENKSLWGSWSVIGPKSRFFFAGDTGYCDVFKQIGKVYGPFNIAAIPIGAYEPRWFMKYQHVNPEEAVKIHEDIGSRFSVAIHWGTFSLANEYYLDPPMKLSAALENSHLPTNTFVTFLHGETRLINTNTGKVERTGTTRRARVT